MEHKVALLPAYQGCAGRSFFQWGGARTKIRGAGQGGAKVKIRRAGRGGAKERVNQLIQKFDKIA